MNSTLTLHKADMELHSIKGCLAMSCDARDTAQWVGVILAELRQQVDLDWNCTLEDLYKATVNLRQEQSK